MRLTKLDWVLATSLLFGGVGLTLATSGAVEASPPRPSFAGEFRGHDLDVAVSRSKRGYSVEVMFANENCIGQAKAPGVVHGSTLEVQAVDEDHKTCRLLIRRRGANLVVTEPSFCWSSHGSACSFAGVVRPVPAHHHR